MPADETSTATEGPGPVDVVMSDENAVAAVPAAWQDHLRIGLLVLPLMLIGLLYWPTFQKLWVVWDTDANYSHGFVVPIFALALAWIAWQRHEVAPVRQSVERGNLIRGGVDIAIGFLMHLVAYFFTYLLLDVAALIFILRGVILAVGGTEAHKAYGFPILFLIFMAPLPVQWQDSINIVMQQFVSGISATLLELCGVPTFRQGYIIDLPGYRMEVGEACSGLRGLIAIVALAAAIGYLSNRGSTYRWTLALLAVPIAIGSNCLRVFGTGIILLLFGKKYAEDTFHTLEGMVMVGLAAVLVVLTAWGLARFENWYRGEADDAAEETIDQATPSTIAT